MVWQRVLVDIRSSGLFFFCLTLIGFAGAPLPGSEPDTGSVSRDLLSDQEWKRLDGAIDRGLSYLGTQHKKNDGSFAAPDTGQPGITSLASWRFWPKGMFLTKDRIRNTWIVPLISCLRRKARAAFFSKCRTGKYGDSELRHIQVSTITPSLD